MWPFKKKRKRPPATVDRQFVYLMRYAGTDFHKIGISKHPERRRRQIANQSGFDVELVGVWQVPSAINTESILHRHFRDRRSKRGEWFALTPTEVQTIKLAMGEDL